ncbi:hypothetical protein BRARA_D00771 [Brassica rapa]|uniref:DUF223 domain-containing protein n=1 Tax=Brassica campestris TaxID=3711 RepID=A0A397ZRA6_BRACM|nr:hypothetical protein BRARA_D00771 [Brassica rapa]
MYKGHKIHASCKKTYFESKGRLLLVGVWRNIRNFQVRPAGGAYRTTNHIYKISFNQATVVSRSNFMNDDLSLNLVDFQSVLSGTLDEKYLIDVLGQVLDCGAVETIQCAGGNQRKKLEFTLRDINDSRIPCCIWGKLTDTLHSACNQDDGLVTLLLRFAKIGKFRGEVQISNSFDASQMIINPAIPDAEAFKDMDTGDDKNLMPYEINEDIQEYIKKQIDQVDKCLVTCTVYEIDMDWSWYYFGCDACQKRVIKTGTKNKIVNGIEITTHIWWCEACNDYVLKVSPRFWLHLMVKDDTVVSKIMILDKVANGIVAESPVKLLNGSWDELEDTSLIPDAITDLIGQSFTFGVYVEKDNESYGAEIYKVGKIYKDRMNCLTGSITPVQSDTPLTITSVDEGSVYLTDSQELNESVSTPSSKRNKDEAISLPDISSTSKKPCLMTVKIEKAEEAAKKRG